MTIYSYCGRYGLSLWVRRWLIRTICALNVLVQCGQGIAPAAVGDLKTLLFLSCIRCAAAEIMLVSWDFAPLYTTACHCYHFSLYILKLYETLCSLPDSPSIPFLISSIHSLHFTSLKVGLPCSLTLHG